MSPSNRSGRLCERFCEFEETGRTALLSKEENHIQPKVEGGKNDFFQIRRERGCGRGLARESKGVGKVAGPTS